MTEIIIWVIRMCFISVLKPVKRLINKQGIEKFTINNKTLSSFNLETG